MLEKYLKAYNYPGLQDGFAYVQLGGGYARFSNGFASFDVAFDYTPEQVVFVNPFQLMQALSTFSASTEAIRLKVTKEHLIYYAGEVTTKLDLLEERFVYDALSSDGVECAEYKQLKRIAGYADNNPPEKAPCLQDVHFRGNMIYASDGHVIICEHSEFSNREFAAHAATLKKMPPPQHILLNTAGTTPKLVFVYGDAVAMVQTTSYNDSARDTAAKYFIESKGSRQLCSKFNLPEIKALKSGGTGVYLKGVIRVGPSKLSLGRELPVINSELPISFDWSEFQAAMLSFETISVSSRCFVFSGGGNYLLQVYRGEDAA